MGLQLRAVALLFVKNLMHERHGDRPFADR